LASLQVVGSTPTGLILQNGALVSDMSEHGSIVPIQTQPLHVRSYFGVLI